MPGRQGSLAALGVSNVGVLSSENYLGAVVVRPSERGVGQWVAFTMVSKVKPDSCGGESDIWFPSLRNCAFRNAPSPF